jgi:hypothetical protein
MGHLGKFFVAFLNHWESLALGGLALFVLWSYAAMTGHSAPIWLYWAGALVAGSIAAYRTWLEEHEKLVAVREQLADSAYPQFEFRFDELNIGSAGPNRDTDPCSIIVVGSVRNIGMQSICESYALRVHTPGGRTYSGTPVAIPTIGIDITKRRTRAWSFDICNGRRYFRPHIEARHSAGSVLLRCPWGKN